MVHYFIGSFRNMASPTQSGITFDVADVQANPVRVWWQPYQKPAGCVQTSTIPTLPRLGLANGFVQTVEYAYSSHHNLVIRPDDVWLAIMIQFSAYVQSHADELQSKLMRHVTEEKIVLTLSTDKDVKEIDQGEAALKFMAEAEQHLQDSVYGWVTPGFSTTTPTDRVVGAMVLLATLRPYVSCEEETECGIPQVTLQGTVEDWQSIEVRAKRLVEFECKEGLMAKWLGMLSPVLEQLTLSASGKPNREWWNVICSHVERGSGDSFISGWLSVFCVFDNKGVWIGDRKRRKHYWMDDDEDLLSFSHPTFAPDGWPVVEMDEIPSGVCKWQIKHTDVSTNTVTKLNVLAGHRAMLVVNERSLAPSVEWAAFVVNEQPK